METTQSVFLPACGDIINASLVPPPFFAMHTQRDAWTDV